MDLYSFHLQPIHLNNIRNGTKIVESRPAHKFAHLKKNDMIYFENNENTKDNIFVIVEDIVRYKTFIEMLLGEGLQNVLPNVSNIEDGLNVYLKPNGFYTKEQEEDGVIALRLKRFNDELNRF